MWSIKRLVRCCPLGEVCLVLFS